MYNDLNPRKIIYSGDCTIVFWYDGTKTIVRRSKGTKDDKHSAFCAALAKKVFSTNSELKRKIKVAENTKRIKPEKRKYKPYISCEKLEKDCIDILRAYLNDTTNRKFNLTVDSMESDTAHSNSIKFTLHHFSY